VQPWLGVLNAEPEPSRQDDVTERRLEPPRSVLYVQAEAGEMTRPDGLEGDERRAGPRGILPAVRGMEGRLALGAIGLFVVADLKEEVEKGPLRVVVDLDDGALVEGHLEAAEVTPASDDHLVGNERDRSSEARSEERSDGRFDARSVFAVPIHANDGVQERFPPPGHCHPEPHDATSPLEVTEAHLLVRGEGHVLFRSAESARRVLGLLEARDEPVGSHLGLAGAIGALRGSWVIGGRA
jgi:hypothetical protein